MKHFFKRNKLNVFLLITLAVAMYFLLKTEVIDNSTIIKVDYISTNSIFAGFLFTSLGIIVSILDKSIIVYLDEHGYLDSYINGIVIGLVFHLCSALIELSVNNFNLSLTESNELLSKKIIFSLLLFGIIFFTKSMFNILKLISIIRKQNLR